MSQNGFIVFEDVTSQSVSHLSHFSKFRLCFNYSSCYKCSSTIFWLFVKTFTKYHVKVEDILNKNAITVINNQYQIKVYFW